VEGQHDSVGRRVDIGLEVAVAEADGRLEGRQRVLGLLGGTAAMGERDGPRMIEERVRGMPAR
jgi:hypothetical protein